MSIINSIGKVFDTIIVFCIRDIPGGAGRRIRYAFYKNKFGACGRHVKIDTGVIISNPQNVFLGNNVWLDNYVILLAGKPKEDGIIIHRKQNPDYIFEEGELHIGDNVHIAPFTVLQAHGGISIEEDCGIASGAKIYSLSNHYKNLNDPADKREFVFTPLAEPSKQAYLLSPVVIRTNCAVGLNSTILPGTTLPRGAWVGVNTYIQGRSLQEDGIYAGEPGKFIKLK
jgi:acetyltransferase-like isoleucine patch superfamily enzyme